MVHDPAKLLERLCGEPREGEWLEFKLNEFDADECGRYVSGLANAAMLANRPHGYLVWGVEDGTHNIVGTSVRLKSEKVGNELLTMWLTHLVDPKLHLEFVSFRYSSSVHIEMIIIDPAYQHPVSFRGEEYIRIESSLTKLKMHRERARALWNITSRLVFERGVAAPHLTEQQIFEQFDVAELFRLMKKPSLNQPGMIDHLVREELIIDNMEGGYDATNLCAIVCARDMRKYPSISGKAPRVVTYKGSSKLDSIGDQDGIRGYAVTFVRLLKYIEDRTPYEEVMLHGVRTKVYGYPMDAVREFLANALIHQDFTSQGDRPIVEIYDDRLEITNPGAPLVEPDRFIDTPSKSRNPKLALMMRKANLCEERGSGVDRALKAIEAQCLPPPLFRVVGNSTVVTMYKQRRFATFTKEERLRACFQHAALLHAANDAMSNRSLRKRLGLDDRRYPEVSEIISDAVAARLIRPVREDQPNRNARYLPHYVP